jgi:hypothetical protein
MNQILTMLHEVFFKPGSAFNEREMKINRDVVAIQETLRQRGFYMLSHDVKSKTDTKATILITYR